MPVADSINAKLRSMKQAGRVRDVREKGALGEAVVLDVMHELRTKRGGLLMQGFMYPYASNRQGKIYVGNIFYDKNRQPPFYDVTSQLNDEIDILYISYYRIFAIEVKSYHARKMVLQKNGWMTREGSAMEKAPTAQAEKHVRHLYHQLYDVLPDGNPNYIIPIVCFVDECSVTDERDQDLANYMPVCPLNTLQQTVLLYDRPLGGYTLDLDMIQKKLKMIQTERTI